ncbi:MAG TPA: sulfite exporter TauE/SafE family protein [Deltaproteobacteria bacterium]|jgi:sulfite exporter TauE/SafE|nr:sulfite exporter TauE/SafE family protein [Deltaproteobacteria bacterium]
MLEIFASFIVGLTGSLHCLGMCGPLIIAWSLRYRSASQAGSKKAGPSLFSGVFLHHLAFHAGRIATYVLLGAIVAGIFSSLEVHRFSMQYRAGFAIASGTALIGLGLVIFGTLPLPHFVARLFSPQASVFGKSLARLANSTSLGSKIELGILAGLLPCGLTWAMLVAAASTLSSAKGIVMMASFGLGTIPALLAAGMSATLVSARTRLFGERAAAIFIVMMGASLAIRGLGVILGFGDHCGPMELLSKSGLLGR